MRQSKLSLFMILAVLMLGFSGISKTVGQAENPVYTDATWSPDGLLFAMVDRSEFRNAVQIFTRELQPTVKLTLESLPDGITQVDARDLSWSPDGTRLAAAFLATDNFTFGASYMVIWDVQTGSEVLRLTNVGRFVSWSPDGTRIATGGQIFDTTTGQLIQDLTSSTSIWHVVWHPTNNNQVLIGGGPFFNVYQVSTGAIIVRYPYASTTSPRFSPDGNHLAVLQSGSSSSIDILDTASYQLVSTISYEGSVLESNNIYWIGNQQIAPTRSLQPDTPIINIYSGQTVDSIDSLGVWNNQGTEFLRFNPVIDGNQLRMAVFDTDTKSVISQYALPSAVRNLELRDSSDILVTPLLSGSGANNDIAIDTTNVFLRAYTTPETVGSVAFDINGSITVVNTSPYAVALPAAGAYTVTVTPYSLPDAQGDAGASLATNITIVAELPGDESSRER